MGNAEYYENILKKIFRNYCASFFFVRETINCYVNTMVFYFAALLNLIEKSLMFFLDISGLEAKFDRSFGKKLAVAIL